MFLRSTFSFALVLAAVSAAPENQPLADSTREEKAARIANLVAPYQGYGYLNGAILIADRGQVIYERGVGFANMESRTPNTPQTKFGVASLTKQFTAALVLQQVGEGRIRLEAPVAEYLAWYRKDTGQRVTIERLLHHTAGLPPDFDDPEFSASKAAAQHYEPRPFAEQFCQQNLVSEPGTKWNYSNCGYVLLGLVLEEVSRKPFGELLRERLLAPLGMADTGMDNNDLEQRGGASGYERHAGPRYRRGPYLDRAHIFAAGAMYSTVEDLYKWSRALSNDSLLPQEIRRQIFTPGLNDWGLGWFITKIPAGTPGAGSTLEEMRGDMPGNYFSWILRYPDQDSVVIVLRNGYGSTENLEANLQAILFDQEPRPPKRSAKDIFAQLYLVLAGWIGAHQVWAVVLVLGIAFVLWLLRRRSASRARAA